jgi:hypothetical protein
MLVFVTTLACRPSVLNPSFSVFFRSREIEFALGHRRLRVQRAPVTYSIQFQHGGFSLSDLRECSLFIPGVGTEEKWVAKKIFRKKNFQVKFKNLVLSGRFNPPPPLKRVSRDGTEYKQGQVKGLTV